MSMFPRVLGGCSSVGRALDCGSSRRGFNPRHSPQVVPRPFGCRGGLQGHGANHGRSAGVLPLLRAEPLRNPAILSAHRRRAATRSLRPASRGPLPISGFPGPRANAQLAWAVGSALASEGRGPTPWWPSSSPSMPSELRRVTPQSSSRWWRLSRSSRATSRGTGRAPPSSSYGSSPKTRVTWYEAGWCRRSKSGSRAPG